LKRSSTGNAGALQLQSIQRVTTSHQRRRNVASKLTVFRDKRCKTTGPDAAHITRGFQQKREERDPVVIQCCVCLRVRQGNRWTSVAKPYKVMRRASHTYCPRCMKESFGSIKKCRA
jgi:hypothetical protein